MCRHCPDPYAANLGVLRAQLERVAGVERSGFTGQNVWLWLVARTSWQPDGQGSSKVDVSFHFAPLDDPLTASPGVVNTQPENGTPAVAPISVVAASPLMPLAAHPFVQLFDANGAAPQVSATAAEASSPLSSAQVQTVMMATPPAPPNYQGQWLDRFSSLENDDNFALLDVSSNAIKWA